MFRADRMVRASCLLPCIIALSVAVVPAGCASVGAAAATDARDANVITRDELQQSGEADMYSAVRRLRPAFLQRLGTVNSFHITDADVLKVYVDGSLHGDVESLRQVPVSQVGEIRRLSAADATQRFGTGHAAGALVIKTRSR